MKFQCDFTEIDKKIHISCFLDNYIWDNYYHLMDRGEKLKEYRLTVYGNSDGYGTLDEYEIIDICSLAKYGALPFQIKRFEYDSMYDPDDPELKESLKSELKFILKHLFLNPNDFCITEEIFSTSENLSSQQKTLEFIEDLAPRKAKKRNKEDRKKYKEHVRKLRIRQDSPKQYIIEVQIASPKVGGYCHCTEVDNIVHVRCEFGSKMEFDYSKIGVDTLKEYRFAISGYEGTEGLIYNYEEDYATIFDLAELEYHIPYPYYIHEFQYDSKQDCSDFKLPEALVTELKTVGKELGIKISEDVRIHRKREEDRSRYKKYVRFLRRQQKRTLEGLERFIDDFNREMLSTYNEEQTRRMIDDDIIRTIEEQSREILSQREAERPEDNSDKNKEINSEELVDRILPKTIVLKVIFKSETKKTIHLDFGEHGGYWIPKSWILSTYNATSNDPQEFEFDTQKLMKLGSSFLKKLIE